jgi:Leucine-rich repeat (LRR) protein
VSSSCLKQLSVLTGLTDLCLLHNSRLEMDDACLASLAKLPNLQILGLGNFQVSSVTAWLYFGSIAMFV